jgi:hypothetical protein
LRKEFLPIEHANHIDAQSEGRSREPRQERFNGCVGQSRAPSDLSIDQEERLQESGKKIYRPCACGWRRRHVGKVSCELIDTGIPLGVLPLGTANNLARSLGFIASPEEIITGLEGAKRRAFDIGVARGPWGKRFFFESVGGGLLADYLRNPKAKAKKTKKLSEEEEMTRHVSLLRDMLREYLAQKWKIEIDGKDISDRYILW